MKPSTRRAAGLLACVTVLLTGCASTAAQAPHDPARTPPATTASAAITAAGTWKGTYASTKYPTTTAGTFRMTIVVTGSDFTGTVNVTSNCVSTGTLAGRIAGNMITFGAVKAAETITFSGTITATTMSGTYHSGAACGDDVGTWKAVKP